MDVPRSPHRIVVRLSSVKPVFVNGLKKAVPFSDDVGAEDPGIQYERDVFVSTIFFQDSDIGGLLFLLPYYTNRSTSCEGCLVPYWGMRGGTGQGRQKKKQS